jgi:hypothetical protein
MIRHAIVALAALAAAASLAGPSARAEDERNLACFGTALRGVACLADGQWRVFDRRSGHLPQDRVTALVACERRIVALVGGAVLAFDGRRWTPPLRPPPRAGGARPQRLACDSFGQWWLAYERELARWDGARWRFMSISAMAGEDSAAAAALAGATIRDVAAGPGAVWAVLSGGRAARLAEGRWTLYRPGAGLPEGAAFARVAVDEQGGAWLPAGEALLQAGGIDARRYPIEAGGVDAVAFDSAGRLWLAAGARLFAVHYGRLVVDRAAPFALRALAPDGAGAVWLAGEFGVGRFQDGAFEWRQMHNADLPDNDALAVAVIGAPAPLPPAIESRPGALAGRLLWRAGVPMGDAAVAICAAAGLVLPGLDAAPCDGKPLAAERHTDADGRFVFLDIPAGNYRLAVRPLKGAPWRVLPIEPERLLVGQRREVSLGDVIVD